MKQIFTKLRPKITYNYATTAHDESYKHIYILQTYVFNC